MIEGEVQLGADCARCFGLCCVALAFARSADFAIDKPAGEPCLHLDTGFGCAIHSDLRARGFPGCTVFDCLGAGQHVSQVTFGGRDWRSSPEIAHTMFEAFARVRELHMLLWHVREALMLRSVEPMHADLRRSFTHLRRLCMGTPEELIGLDVGERTRAVRDLLRRASALARAPAPEPRADYANTDLIGAKLAGADLRGANLRGTQLIGADLRGASLWLADLTAADMRDADLRGADLSDALFLRQAQLDAARGDATTRLPPRLHHPAHWLPATGRRQ